MTKTKLAIGISIIVGAILWYTHRKDSASEQIDRQLGVQIDPSDIELKGNEP